MSRISKIERAKRAGAAMAVEAIPYLDVEIPATTKGTYLTIEERPVGVEGTERQGPTYRITKHPREGFKCSCPDNRYRGRECKHIAKLRKGEAEITDLRFFGGFLPIFNFPTVSIPWRNLPKMPKMPRTKRRRRK